MRTRQLVALFVCSTVAFVAGNAQGALLPVYLTHLGVDSASIGNYMALVLLALAVGTIIAGWLSDRFQKRKLILVGATLLMVPLSWQMSQATQVGQLIVLLALIWLLGGSGLAMVNILAGLFAPEDERGRIFGILGLTASLGTLLGGALTGIVVQQWGFITLFIVVALINLITPISACFLEDKPALQDHARGAVTAQAGLVLGLPFYLLLVAGLMTNAAGSFIGLGRPLLMDKTGFDGAAIASVISVGGAVGLPIPLLTGWLSDRLGRFRLLALAYIAGGVSVLMLGVSMSLWHFWVGALLAAALGAGNAVALALVTDLVPKQGLVLQRHLGWS
jgi:ACDE family multidrug resistance protein